MSDATNQPDTGPAPVSRREALRTIGRTTLLGAAGAVAAVLVGRSVGGEGDGKGAPAGGACTGKGYCRQCAAVTGCGLPQAHAYRRLKARRTVR